MDAARLADILASHKKWLAVCGGARADLSRADLSRADLSRADLRGADLGGAYLSGANLSGAYLSNAKGLPNAPSIAHLDAQIYRDVTGGYRLAMRFWHTCETTHCRAGQAIRLAGEAGAELERQFGPNVAGALIYAASRPDKPIPDWYASNDEALEDLRRCAEEDPLPKHDNQSDVRTDKPKEKLI